MASSACSFDGLSKPRGVSMFHAYGAGGVVAFLADADSVKRSANTENSNCKMTMNGNYQCSLQSKVNGTYYVASPHLDSSYKMTKISVSAGEYVFKNWTLNIGYTFVAILV